MPQLCFNSKAVRHAVADRAGHIGREVARGVARLHEAGRDDLFAGVIAGWETQIGRDFATNKDVGYRALLNAGYSAAHPPADVDVARTKVVRDFIAFWGRSLVDAGVPRGKVFSHIAYQSETLYRLARLADAPRAAVPYLRTIQFTPPAVAFADACIAGVSTYPQPGHLEQWHAERAKHGNPPWASCEGTAIDPAQAERNGKGMRMEHYLGNLFNHDAVLVTVFGWGVGERDNPFRKIAEGPDAVAAYKKFLSGARLAEAAIPVPALPPAGLPEKIRKVQKTLPGWIAKHGPAEVKDHVARLDAALRQRRFEDAAKAADAILRIIAK